MFFKIFSTELSTHTRALTHLFLTLFLRRWKKAVVCLRHFSYNLFAEKKPQDALAMYTTRTGAVECTLNLFCCRFDALKIQQIRMNVYGTPCYLYPPICVCFFSFPSFSLHQLQSHAGRHCQMQHRMLATGQRSYTVCNRVKSSRPLETRVNGFFNPQRMRAQFSVYRR